MGSLLLATLIFALPTQPPQTRHNDGNVQVAVMCFKTGERESGMNKICYYDCLGSEAAITIKSFELCPLSIQN